MKKTIFLFIILWGSVLLSQNYTERRNCLTNYKGKNTDVITNYYMCDAAFSSNEQVPISQQSSRNAFFNQFKQAVLRGSNSDIFVVIDDVIKFDDLADAVSTSGSTDSYAYSSNTIPSNTIVSVALASRNRRCFEKKKYRILKSSKFSSFAYTELSKCAASGRAEFTLSDFENYNIGSRYTYFEGSNEITTPNITLDTSSTTQKIISARINTYDLPGATCSQKYSTELVLKTASISANSVSYKLCGVSNLGNAINSNNAEIYSANFDFSTIDNQVFSKATSAISGTPDSTPKIRYYTNEINAQSNLGALTESQIRSYRMSGKRTDNLEKTIYARVSSGDCSEIVEIHLKVLTPAVLTQQALTLEGCVNTEKNEAVFDISDASSKISAVMTQTKSYSNLFIKNPSTSSNLKSATSFSTNETTLDLSIDYADSSRSNNVSCTFEGKISLKKLFSPNAQKDDYIKYSLCERIGGGGTGKANFDLTTQDDIIKNEVNNLPGTTYRPADIRIAYFSSVNRGMAINKGMVNLGRKISDTDKTTYENATRNSEIIRSVAYISHVTSSGQTKLCGSFIDVNLVVTPRMPSNPNVSDMVACESRDRFNLKAKAHFIAKDYDVDLSEISIYESNSEANQDTGMDLSSEENYQNTTSKELFVSIQRCGANNVSSFKAVSFKVKDVNLNNVIDCPNPRAEYPMTANFSLDLLTPNVTTIRNNSSDDVTINFYEDVQDAVSNTVSNSDANQSDYKTAMLTFTNISYEKPTKEIYLVAKQGRCESLKKVTINYNILTVNDLGRLNYQKCSSSGAPAVFDLNAIRSDFESQANTQFSTTYNAQVYNNTNPPILSTGTYPARNTAYEAFVRLSTSSSNAPTSCPSIVVPVTFTVIGNNNNDTFPVIDKIISGCGTVNSSTNEGRFNFAERITAIQNSSSSGLNKPYSNVRIYEQGSTVDLASETSHDANHGDVFSVVISFNDGISTCDRSYDIEASVLNPKTYTFKHLTACDDDDFDLSLLETEVSDDLLASGAVPGDAEYKLYLYQNQNDANSRVNNLVFKHSTPAPSHIINLQNYRGANNQTLHAVIALERNGFACATQSTVPLNKVTRNMPLINFTTCRSTEDDSMGGFHLKTVVRNGVKGMNRVFGYKYENVILSRVESGDVLPSALDTDISILPEGSIVVTADRVVENGNLNYVCKVKGNVKLHLLRTPKFFKNKSEGIIVSGCESNNQAVFDLNQYTPPIRERVYNSNNLNGVAAAAGSAGGTLDIAYNISPVIANIVSTNVYLNPKGSSSIPEATYDSYRPTSLADGAGVAYITYPPGNDRSFIANVSQFTIYCTAVIPLKFSVREVPNFGNSYRTLNYSFCQDENTPSFATFDINSIGQDIERLITSSNSNDIISKDFYYYNSKSDAESKVDPTGKVMNIDSNPLAIPKSSLSAYKNTVADSQEFGYVYAYTYSDGFSCGVSDIFNVDVLNTKGVDISLKKCVSDYQNDTASFDIRAQRGVLTAPFSSSGVTVNTNSYRVFEKKQNTTNLASSRNYNAKSTILEYSFDITRNQKTCQVKGEIDISALSSPSIPPSTPLSNFILCEETPGSQRAEFDLSSKLLEITNKEKIPSSSVIFDTSKAASDARISDGQVTDDTGGIQGNNITAYRNTQQTQIIGVTLVARHRNTLCGSSTSFDIKAESIKSLTGLSELLNCNGSQSFNLREKKSEIVTSNSTSTFILEIPDIKIYQTLEEANGTVTSVTDLSDRVAHSIAPSSIETFYVKSEKGCYNIDSFRTVAFNPKKISIASIEGCPPVSNNIEKTNSFTIDITNKNDEITRGVSEFTISYFKSLPDAENDRNEIISTTNYQINNITRKNRFEKIYAKITYVKGAESCVAYTSFDAGITFPNIDIGGLVECEGATANQSTFDIAARKQIIDGQLSADISDLRIYQEGNYSTDLSNRSNYTSATKTLVLTMNKALNSSTNCRINDILGLLVSKRPRVVMPTSDYEVCEVIVGDGRGIFNLRSRDSEITDDTNTSLPTVRNSVSWYSSPGGANTLINTPEDYESASKVVIGRVFGADPNTNKVCTTDINLTLTVNLTINIADRTNSICSKTNEADFNLLRIKNDIISRDARISNASELAFYETEDESNGRNQNPVDISSNENYSSQDARIYIKHAPTCRVGIIQLDVKDGRITANKPSRDLYICNYTPSSIDPVVNLSEKDLEILGNQNVNITYYANQNSAISGSNSIQNPSNYTVSDRFPVDIYARVENSDGCFDITDFDIKTNEPIRLTNSINAFFECDNKFNLSGAIASKLIENLNVSNFSVKFYENDTDATNDTNTITVLKQNGNLETLRTITADQILYARVEHTVSQCFEKQTVSLSYKAPRDPLTISDYIICSENVSGIADYDLVQKEADIISENPSLSSVSRSELKMFRTIDEAMDRVNDPDDISTNSNYTTLDNTRIYFQSGSRCNVFEFTLKIRAKVFAYDIPNIKGCIDKLGNPLPIEFISTRQDIIGSQNLADVRVTFYSNSSDALSGFNPLDDGSGNNKHKPSTYPVDIFVRVINEESKCSATNSFTVEAASAINTFTPNRSIGSCEGFVDFNELVAPAVLGDLDAIKYDISYHKLSSDAENDRNEILSTGSNNISKFKVSKGGLSIYIRVEDKETKCYNVERAILSEENAERPVLLNDKLLESCDYDQNKEEIFNLLQIRSQISENPSQQKFEFFNTPPTSINVKKIEDDRLSSYKAIKPVQRLYARATNNDSKCQSTVSFLVRVNPIPILEVKNASLIRCELDDDFKEFFDLTESEEKFFGRYNKSGEVTYYLNESEAKEGDDSKSLPKSYTNETPLRQNIGVRFENIYKCFLTGILTLNVGKAKLTNRAGTQTIQVCDGLYDKKNDEDGISIFNLTVKEDDFRETLNETSPGIRYSYTYHNNAEDALRNINKIQNIEEYTNIDSSFKKDIIVRIQDVSKESCDAISGNLELKVNPIPKLSLPESGLFCIDKDEKPEPIGVNLGLSIDYLWTTKETTSIIIPKTEGEYKVTTTNRITGCTYTSNAYNLKISSLPKKVNIITSPFSNNGYIKVNIENHFGKDKILYALDNKKYTPSSDIDNVSPGEHILYIKDKNGCGNLVRNVFVPGYVNFLTPNGDTINDTWEIYGVRDLPRYRSTVSVYDRYSSKIITYNPNKYEWDGTYDGRKLPADDYWFVIRFRRGDNEKWEIYKGHVALKR